MKKLLDELIEGEDPDHVSEDEIRRREAEFQVFQKPKHAKRDNILRKHAQGEYYPGGNIDRKLERQATLGLAKKPKRR